MVYMKRILFLVFVISFLCDGLVDSNGIGDNDGEIRKDVNSIHGVIEISKERDKRRVASLQKECADCNEAVQDWDSLHPRSKRATKSKIRRKSKKRFKKLADSPVANSKSFTNIYSRFWKDEKTSSSLENDPDKNDKDKRKKNKVKKRKGVSIKKHKTPVKGESLSSSGPKSNSKSLVNFYSNYWKGGNKKGSSIGDKPAPNTKTSVKGSEPGNSSSRKGKGKSQSKKERLGEKDDDADSSKSSSGSLLNHFSSFWKDSDGSGSSTDTNTQKTPKKITKPKKSKRKNKKNKSRPDKKESLSQTALKRGRNTKEEKLKEDKEVKNDNKMPISSSNYDTKDDEKARKKEKSFPSDIREAKKIQSETSGDNESIKNDGRVGSTRGKAKEMKVRKTKTNKRRLKKMKEKKERLKSSKKTKKDKKEKKDDLDKTSGSWDSVEIVEDSGHTSDKTSIKSESRTEEINRIMKERKRYEKTKSRNKAGHKGSKTQNIPEGEQIFEEAKKNDIEKQHKGNQKASVVDFQGLKSGLEDSVTVAPNPAKPAIEVESTSKTKKTTLTTQEAPKPTKPTRVTQNSIKSTKGAHATVRGSAPLPTKSSTVSNGAQEITKPAKIEKPLRKKKLKKNSKKLGYFELLAKSESDFRRRDEKIRKKYAALRTKIGKRYQKYKSLDKRLNEVLPTATFNFSHPKQLSRVSQVSMTDLKKMIIKLNNDSDSLISEMQSDDPRMSIPRVPYPDSFDKNKNKFPQASDPDYDLNYLIDLSHKSTRKYNSKTKSDTSRDKAELRDLNNLIEHSRKTGSSSSKKIGDDMDIKENKAAANLNGNKSPKKSLSGFSLLKYYSKMWKNSGSKSLSSKKSRKTNLNAKKSKKSDKKRRRKEERQRLISENGKPANALMSEEEGLNHKILGEGSPKTMSLSETKKRRKSLRIERRKRMKKILKERRKSDRQKLRLKADKDENVHHLKKRSVSETSVANDKRKSRKRVRKFKRKGKAKKAKADKISVEQNSGPQIRSSSSLRSPDNRSSQRDGIYSRRLTRQKLTRKSKTRNKRMRMTFKKSKGVVSKRNRKNRRGGIPAVDNSGKPDYIADQEMKEGPKRNMEDDETYGSRARPRSRLYRLKAPRSKSKRGRNARRDRLLKRKRNRKQQRDSDKEPRSKRPRYDDRYYGDVRYRDDDFRDNVDRGRYSVDNRNDDYYYNGDRDEVNDYHYADGSGQSGRGRPSRYDDRYEDDRYDKGRGSRRRHYDDRGQRLYTAKELFGEDYRYSRRFKNLRRVSDYEDSGGEILYYIYPMRRGSNARRRYNGPSSSDRYDGDVEASGRYPIDSRRGGSYPRRGDDYDGYNDNNSRQPLDRRGHSPSGARYSPEHERRPAARKPDNYGSSRRGEPRYVGRDGRRPPAPERTRPSEGRYYDNNRERGRDFESAGKRNHEFDSGGQTISSRINPVDQDRSDAGRRRPVTGRERNDYAELERRRQQERIRAYERQRERQLERLAPRVNQKIQVLKRHLQGVLRYYTSAMARSEQMYQDIFNGTRYDIMAGMGGIYKDLNEANEDIYVAVTSASRTARGIYMKAHRARTAQLKGLTLDESSVDAKELRKAESTVKNRDFRQSLLKAQMEKRQIEIDKRHVKMLEMKFNQGKARLQQVKEYFKERYDHQILLDIFSNMRASIDFVNEEIAYSYNFRPLRRDRMYIDHTKKEMGIAKKTILGSREAVRNGQRQLMEINGLYRKYEAEKQRHGRQHHRGQGGRGHRRSKRDVDPREFERLKQMTSNCKRHSRALNQSAVYVQRTLARPIMLGRRAIEQRGQKVPMSQLTPLVVRLRRYLKEMFMALDKLREYVDSQPKIILPIKCSERLIEGSGAGNGDDEDYECLEEEEEHINVGGDYEDDFTFETNDKGTHESSVSHDPFVSFIVRLSEYTAQLLSKSGSLHESALHVLTKATKGLRSRLQVSTLGKDLSLKKDVQSNLFVIKTYSEEVKLRLSKISEKLDRVNRIDFAGIEAKAIQAIKRAEEGPREVFETTTKKAIIEVPTSKENKTNPRPEESSAWEVFRKADDIESNRKNIKYLQSLALSSYVKGCTQMDKIQNNIFDLRQKVEKARKMLSSLQLSVSKTGDSPIPMAIPPSPTSYPSGTFTATISIKPKSLDGTVLYLQGNQSASFTVTLDQGELSANAYDKDNDDLNSVTLDDLLENDKWYTIQLTRAGSRLSLSVNGQDGESEADTESIRDLSMIQPIFTKSFIGGVPGDVKIGQGSWQGCIGEFVLNGESLSTFQPSLDGQQPTLCTDHSVSEDRRKLTWSFDGDGFVHYSQAPLENVQSLSVSFQTTQPTGSILSAFNSRKRFHLYVSFENGAIKVQTWSETLRTSNDSLNDGTLHMLKVTFRSGRINAELDGDDSAFSAIGERLDPYREIKDGVLLGSFVSESRKYLKDRYRPFVGCVGGLLINEKPLLSLHATETYNAHYGSCGMKSVWQSCARFNENSLPISLGSVENSNVVTLLVSKNAIGPLLLYEKKDKIKIQIVMTSDSIEITDEEEESVLVKEASTDVTDDDVFTLVTIDDMEEKVTVKAFGQSASFDYSSFWSTSDPDAPHTINLGQARDEDNSQSFVGAISQFTIGDRTFDLTQYFTKNKLERCTRQLSESIPNQNVIPKEMNLCS